MIPKTEISFSRCSRQTVRVTVTKPRGVGSRTFILFYFIYLFLTPLLYGWNDSSTNWTGDVTCLPALFPIRLSFSFQNSQFPWGPQLNKPRGPHSNPNPNVGQHMKRHNFNPSQHNTNNRAAALKTHNFLHYESYNVYICVRYNKTSKPNIWHKGILAVSILILNLNLSLLKIIKTFNF